MPPSRSLHRLERRIIEPGLALAVLVLAGIFFVELVFAIGRSILFSNLLLPASFGLPLILSLIVLTDLIGRAVSFVSSARISGLPRPRQSMWLLSVLGSAVIGGVALYTMWLASVSIFIVYFGTPGGVLLHPYIVLAVASALSILILVRAFIATLIRRNRLENRFRRRVGP